MDLVSILEIDDKKLLDKELRKAFSPYSLPIAVDGEELACLIILINSTIPRNKIKDIIDKQQAQELWKDDGHLDKCLTEVGWYHTHNLKYPDARVSHQVYRGDSPTVYPNVLSSANLPYGLGLANNSAMVNYAKLFSAEFLWRGDVLTLGTLLTAKQPLWLDKLVLLGVKKNKLDSMIAYLDNELSQKQTPHEISDYSKQLRFMVTGKLIAVTPIVSHTVQAKIHKLAPSLRTTTISHGHPASVSGLVASVGGFSRVLNYYPSVKRNRTKDFITARRDKKGCFDNSVLSSKSFVNALKCIAKENLAPTVRQRRQLRVSALRFIRKQLILWLAPMMEWRDSEPNANYDTEPNGIENKLIVTPLEQLPQLVAELNLKFHQSIQFNKYASRYAFHPELILPIKMQLSWLLRYLATPMSTTVTTNSHVYLHLQQLKVSDASSLSNPYVAGIPSLTALWGFVEYYQLRLNKLAGTSIDMESVAWFISEYQEIQTKKLPEPCIPVSKRSASNIKRSGIIDGKYCDLTVDLIIALRIPDEETTPTKQLLQAALPSKFAGGTLLPPALYEQRDWLNIYSSRSELFSVVSRFPKSGCWIYSDSGKLDSFQQLEQRLKLDPDLKPVNMGFIALEKPQERVNSIAEQHCFAEPCLGVVQCKNAIEVRLEGANQFFDSAFWHLSSENTAMLMQTHHKD